MSSSLDAFFYWTFPVAMLHTFPHRFETQSLSLPPNGPWQASTKRDTDAALKNWHSLLDSAELRYSLRVDKENRRPVRLSCQHPMPDVHLHSVTPELFETSHANRRPQTTSPPPQNQFWTHHRTHAELLHQRPTKARTLAFVPATAFLGVDS